MFDGPRDPASSPSWRLPFPPWLLWVVGGVLVAGVYGAYLGDRYGVLERWLERDGGPVAFPPAGEPSEGMVAYIGSDGSLYWAAFEEPEPVRVNRASAQVMGVPAWSSDGRYLAYVDNHPSRGMAAWVASRVNGEVETRQVWSKAFPIAGNWRPAEDSLSLLVGDRGAMRLHLIEDGASARVAMPNASRLFWAWSDDGRWLAVHTMGELYWGEGRADRRLPPEMLRFGGFQTPAWSADGSRLFFIRTDDLMRFELCAFDPAAGSVENVLPLAELPRRTSFRQGVRMVRAPGSNRLALLSSYGQFSQGSMLVVADADAGTMDALGEGNQTAVFWSPDGTRLATMSSSMVPGTANMVAPLMRSELRCVVYDMGSREVLRDFEFAATRALLRILPYFDQYSRSFDVWSPDSRCLLLPTMHDERMEAGQLTVYDVETDAPPRVWQSGQLAVWSPRPAGGVETEARAEGR